MAKVKVGDITTSCLGKMLDVEKNQGEYEPYLANVNVRWGSFDLSDLSKMRFKPDEKERYEVVNGDLVMCEGGEPGRCAIWRSEVPQMKIQKALHRIRANEGTDIEYLYYWFLYAGKNHLIDGYFTGSTIKHLPGDKLKLIELDLPEYEKQQGISKTLSIIDKKIVINTTICSDLEAMAKLLYDYWFVQFDFPDANGKPYKSSGGKMVWNEELKREIPEGWDVKRLGNHIRLNRGVSYTGKDISETGTPIISLASVDRDGRYIPDAIKYYSQPYSAEKVLRPFDLIMANTDMTQERAVMGKIIFVPDIFDGDVLHTHHITKVTIEDDMKCYLMMTTQTTWFHDYIKGFSSGTNVLGMDMIGFEDYMMIWPEKDVLQEFNSLICCVFKKVFSIYKENFELASLRDFLLPMMMNGQVKVGNTSD